MKMLNRLWADEAGFVVSAELTLVAVLLVIGMIVGLTTVRDQVVTELSDVAGAISDLNQSYSFDGIVGHHSATAGSDYVDLLDTCDAPGQAGVNAACVVIANLDDEEGAQP